jgi:hypothetical protein
VLRETRERERCEQGIDALDECRIRGKPSILFWSTQKQRHTTTHNGHLPSSNVCNNKPDALCGLQAKMSKEHSDATRRRDLDGEGDTLGEFDAEPRDSQGEEDKALNEDRGLVYVMQVDASRIRISCAVGKMAPRVRRRFQNALSQHESKTHPSLTARIQDTPTHPHTHHRSLPRNAASSAEPHDVVGEVGIETHARRQRERQVRHSAHQSTANEGGNGGSGDKLAAIIFDAQVVLLVVEAACEISSCGLGALAGPAVLAEKARVHCNGRTRTAFGS